MLFQLGQQDVVENGVLAIHMAVNQFADARQRLMRLQAVSASLFAGEGDLLLEAGDTDFEEFVEVAGEDQQELEPLEQRVGLIERLFQHADVELQLRQLAMDVETAVIQIGHRDDMRSWMRRFQRGDHFNGRLDHGSDLLVGGRLIDRLRVKLDCGFGRSFGAHE